MTTPTRWTCDVENSSGIWEARGAPNGCVVRFLRASQDYFGSRTKKPTLRSSPPLLIHANDLRYNDVQQSQSELFKNEKELQVAKLRHFATDTNRAVEMVLPLCGAQVCFGDLPFAQSVLLVAVTTRTNVTSQQEEEEQQQQQGEQERNILNSKTTAYVLIRLNMAGSTGMASAPTFECLNTSVLTDWQQQQQPQRVCIMDNAVSGAHVLPIIHFHYCTGGIECKDTMSCSKRDPVLVSSARCIVCFTDEVNTGRFLVTRDDNGSDNSCSNNNNNNNNNNKNSNNNDIGIDQTENNKNGCISVHKHNQDDADDIPRWTRLLPGTHWLGSIDTRFWKEAECAVVFQGDEINFAHMFLVTSTNNNSKTVISNNDMSVTTRFETDTKLKTNKIKGYGDNNGNDDNSSNDNTNNNNGKKKKKNINNSNTGVQRTLIHISQNGNATMNLSSVTDLSVDIVGDVEEILVGDCEGNGQLWVAIRSSAPPSVQILACDDRTGEMRVVHTHVGVAKLLGVCDVLGQGQDQVVFVEDRSRKTRFHFVSASTGGVTSCAELLFVMPPELLLSTTSKPGSSKPGSSKQGSSKRASSSKRPIAGACVGVNDDSVGIVNKKSAKRKGEKNKKQLQRKQNDQAMPPLNNKRNGADGAAGEDDELNSAKKIKHSGAPDDNNNNNNNNSSPAERAKSAMRAISNFLHGQLTNNDKVASYRLSRELQHKTNLARILQLRSSTVRASYSPFEFKRFTVEQEQSNVARVLSSSANHGNTETELLAKWSEDLQVLTGNSNGPCKGHIDGATVNLGALGNVNDDKNLSSSNNTCCRVSSARFVAEQNYVELMVSVTNNGRSILSNLSLAASAPGAVVVAIGRVDIHRDNKEKDGEGRRKRTTVTTGGVSVLPNQTVEVFARVSVKRGFDLCTATAITGEASPFLRLDVVMLWDWCPWVHDRAVKENVGGSDVTPISHSHILSPIAIPQLWFVQAQQQQQQQHLMNQVENVSNSQQEWLRSLCKFSSMPVGLIVPNLVSDSQTRSHTQAGCMLSVSVLLRCDYSEKDGNSNAGTIFDALTRARIMCVMDDQIQQQRTQNNSMLGTQGVILHTLSRADKAMACTLYAVSSTRLHMLIVAFASMLPRSVGIREMQFNYAMVDQIRFALDLMKEELGLANKVDDSVENDGSIVGGAGVLVGRWARVSQSQRRTDSAMADVLSLAESLRIFLSLKT